MSCCPTNNNESISILNKTREAAVCAQTNCASAEESAEAAALSAYAASVSAGQAAASAALSGIYLGPKATAPTTDNEGNPLQEGMQYFNTTDGVLYIWNGTSWQSSAFNEFTDFLATGTTTARDLVTRMADVVNVKDFGAVGDGVADDTDKIQSAINFVASQGGGELFFPALTYKINSTIVFSSNLYISAKGAKFNGNGSNTLFETGYFNGLSVVSNISEYGTGSVGAGTHGVKNLTISGLETNNCGTAFRIHRFNDGCEIIDCTFHASNYAIVSTHGWSQRIVKNRFYATLKLQDFFDWTVVESNNFEGITTLPAMVLGQNQSGKQLVSIVGSGSNAYGLATISGGAVTSVSVREGGTGYVNGESVSINAISGTGFGSGTIGTISTTGGEVISVVSITNGGSGYQDAETTYGGSWTLRISNNGFHFCTVGILFQVQCQNTEITGNHFESSTRHIWQNSDLYCDRLRIENNHLASTVPDVTAVEFYALRASEIKLNDFQTALSGTYRYRVVLNRDATYGNSISSPVAFDTSNGDPNTSLYLLRDTNYFIQSGGELNTANTQLTSEMWGGSGNYTFEKYKAQHRYIDDNIPQCQISKNSTSITIDTFVDWDGVFGLRQPVLFYLNMAGSLRNYRKTGVIAGTDITYFQDVELVVAGAPAPMTVSNNSGKLRITITSATSDTYYAIGFVKAM